MTDLKVEIVKINSILNHPNADRLEILTLENKDWQIISKKGSHKVNDLVVYFPIDSILPKNVEDLIFPPESKIKLEGHRIRSIKLRGALSQGMIISPYDLGLTFKKLGDDVTKELGITKYEPIVKQSHSNPKAVYYKQVNPYFNKYTDIGNSKNYPDIFQEGEEVVFTEKIHGTNFRAGWVPYYPNTLFKKLLKFLKLSPSYEFVYGSHNVQLQNKFIYNGFYENNIYAEIVYKEELKERLNHNEVVYGEIYGDGVQKDYTYGCKSGVRNLVLFDVKKDNKFLDYDEFIDWCKYKNIDHAPELYRGPFNKEVILSLRDGPSLLDHSQKIREGGVLRPLKEGSCYLGRKILKYISDNYLLKNQDNESLPH